MDELSAEQRIEALERDLQARERDLQAERAFTRRYLDLGNNVFVLITSDERVHIVNRAATELLGYKSKEISGENWFDVVVPQHQREAQRRRFREVMAGSRELFRQFSESQVETKAGDVRDILWGVSILTSPTGRPIGQMMSGEDVTEQRRAKQTIEHMAFHDGLTGLPNRAFLQRHLPTILEQAGHQQWSVGLLFMDFDNFKTCNDTYGHAAGDELLRQISGRLQGILRPADTVARLGGDEFVMVLPDLSQSRGEARLQATQVGRRLRETFSIPFQLSETVEHRSGASVGIAFAPFDENDPDALLTCADNAMYEAKQNGKNQFAFWSDVQSAAAIKKAQEQQAPVEQAPPIEVGPEPDTSGPRELKFRRGVEPEKPAEVPTESGNVRDLKFRRGQ